MYTVFDARKSFKDIHEPENGSETTGWCYKQFALIKGSREGPMWSWFNSKNILWVFFMSLRSYFMKILKNKSYKLFHESWHVTQVNQFYKKYCMSLYSNNKKLQNKLL